ncbi:MAG: ATP synthase subunit I [Deltaproteobacteria bacterium]|nr:ATP synthase subunit I [Deltaproteobacteria bacterium]
MALLVAGSGPVVGTRFSLSVLCGGLLAMANFHVLYGTLRRAFISTASASGASVVVVFKYYIRLILTGIAIFLLLKFGNINPVGLLLGLSTVVINLVLFGFFEFYKNYIKEA